MWYISDWQIRTASVQRGFPSGAPHLRHAHKKTKVETWVISFLWSTAPAKGASSQHGKRHSRHQQLRACGLHLCSSQGLLVCFEGSRARCPALHCSPFPTMCPQEYHLHRGLMTLNHLSHCPSSLLINRLKPKCVAQLLRDR